ERSRATGLTTPTNMGVMPAGSISSPAPPYGVQPSTPGVPRPAGWWTKPIPGKEQACHGVYRIATDRGLHPVADDFALPNGLAFSPDESRLYIDDSAHKHIRAFDVRPDGTLTGGRLPPHLASRHPAGPDRGE